MLPRHTNELLGHLENVADVGCAVIRRDLLLHWYGQQRLTVNIWRDLKERWQEVLDQMTGENTPTAPLYVGEAEGVITLIWGEGLTTNGDWLQDVSILSTSSFLRKSPSLSKKNNLGRSTT